MTQVPEIPPTPPRDDPDQPGLPPTEEGPPGTPDDERVPNERVPDERPGGPIMEAPGAESGTAMEAASWNPARGDHSFGYGAGAIGTAHAAVTTGSIAREPAGAGESDSGEEEAP